MVCCGLCRGLRPWVVPCGHGLLGFEAMVVGEGGDIEWVVPNGGHEGWVGCFCLENRDTQKERQICLMENKNKL